MNNKYLIILSVLVSSLVAPISLQGIEGPGQVVKSPTGEAPYQPEQNNRQNNCQDNQGYNSGHQNNYPRENSYNQHHHNGYQRHHQGGNWQR